MRTAILALFAAAALACGAGSNGTTSEALTSDELPAYGMNYGGLNWDQIHPELLAGAHMGLERAWWPRVDDVHSFDGLMYAAAKSNVSVVPIVFAFYQVGGYTPANRPDWKNYLTAVAQRFGPGGSFWSDHTDVPYLPVRAWEIWNEENTPMFWTGDDSGTVSPANYYDALQAAHQALRAVDPNARIIFGGITDFPDRHPHDALDFLAQITNMPGGNCLYDAVAVHPYSETVPLAVSRVQATRTRLDGLGLPDVDIWITEIGWALAGPWQRDASGLITQTPFTTPDQYYQAKHFADFATAMDAHRAEWHIGPTIWFNYQDVGDWDGNDGRWDYHCGLMGLDGAGQPTVTRKAWHAAVTAATRTQSVSLPKVRCAP
ncbi:MAG TPA: hypothetical protein VGH28_33920 [Polyangiaceae bacterium]|jgi:hypothetical protein